jgi:hypothetical protein
MMRITDKKSPVILIDPWVFGYLIKVRLNDSMILQSMNQDSL